MKKSLGKGAVGAFFGALLLPVLALAGPPEYGVDRPGFDYLVFDLTRPRSAACEQRCLQETRCKAWTYVKAGAQGRYARCYLKTRVPAPYPDRNCISGVKDSTLAPAFAPAP